MKSKSDILVLKAWHLIPGDRRRLIEISDASKAMDEYAEEYAKAFAVFCQVDGRRRTVDDLMTEFKESLKKITGGQR